MGWLSNRVDRSSLKPGDHIYTWRAAYLYAHHGIYVGDNKVIHFTNEQVGTSSFSSRLSVSSKKGHTVVMTSLETFLDGDDLYRYEYDVSWARFLTTVRDGTCSPAASDPDYIVIQRAKYFLENGFGSYDVLSNNCIDFAVYCKIGRRAVFPEKGL